VAAGLGLLGPLSQLFPVEDSAKTVVLLIGMAVGVDYALFFVVRSRAERIRGSAVDEALVTTLRTSGRTVIVSGATVAIAMAGMSTALLVTLAYPALSLRLSKPSDLALTAQHEPALKALADVRRAFPSAGETAVITVEAPAAAKNQLRQQLHRLDRLAVREGIANTPVDS